MDPGLLILLIPVLILGLFYLFPELLRWLSRRNRAQAEKLRQGLTDTGESLRTLAARLRPYRDLTADTFRRHYEPARERLQKVVDAYQRLQRRLANVAPDDKPYGLWAFMHILNNPEEIWRGPSSAVQLWRMQRELAGLRADLQNAEALIARAEETPGGLVQAARQLRGQRLAALDTGLAEEEEAGLATAKALRARLGQLQRQTDMLLDTMQDGSASGLGRMDTLASELEELEQAVAALEADSSALRKQRRAVDARLQEVEAGRTVTATAVGDEATRDAIQPLLQRAAALEKEGRAAQRAERFAQAEQRAKEALELLNLAGELALAARRVHALQEVAPISLQAEGIDALGRRLQTTYRAAYALCDAPAAGAAEWPATGGEEGGDAGDESKPAGGGRQDAVAGLKLRVNHLAAEAQQLQEAHARDVKQVAQEANEQAEQLQQAWQALQQTVTLPRGDPAIGHYDSLQEQRARAAGDPLKLKAYGDEAQQLARELATATDTIRHGFRQLETLRVELPEMLEKAEAEARNWRSLQPLLTEMKESIATLWQLGGADVHLAEMQATLSEIETLEEQVRAAYAALTGERRRLAVLERRIYQTLQTLTLRRSGDFGGNGAATRNDWKERVDSRLSTARNAATIELAHRALQDTLTWIQGL